MRAFVAGFLVIVLTNVFSNSAKADLRVALIDEATLPYDLSPSNYKNSSSKYENSESNYKNSSSNYENSESNYKNSSSNYENGESGHRRLILKKEGSYYFIGYYVMASNGTTNYFSQNGKRIFYGPKDTDAIFCQEDGEFCGVLANIDGKFCLGLTKRGWKILLLSE